LPVTRQRPGRGESIAWRDASRDRSDRRREPRRTFVAAREPDS